MAVRDLAWAKARGGVELARAALMLGEVAGEVAREVALLALVGVTRRGGEVVCGWREAGWRADKMDRRESAREPSGLRNWESKRGFE